MKKILSAALAACIALSCDSLRDEWSPVFSGKYDTPEIPSMVTMTPNCTVAEVANMYMRKGNVPFKVTEDLYLGGKVISTDQPGNFYKSFYIQDETGGIEIKVGKNSLYSEYKEGQTVYVNLRDLYVGMYGFSASGGKGMVQVGFSDPSGKYETSYIESPLMIDAHILKGEYGDPVEPEVVSSPALLPGKNDTQASNHLIGKLVTLKGLQYANESFTLLYVDNSKDTSKDNPENRVFLSDAAWGITTWAMSKNKFLEYLDSGIWDTAEVGSGASRFGPITGTSTGLWPGEVYKDVLRRNANAYSVSQYFKMGSTVIQIRTSGYGKFGDMEMSKELLSGQKTIDVTGVLTMYQGGIQLVVNRYDDLGDY